MTLHLIPTPDAADALGDLADINRALALLTRAATRADNLLAMADGYTTIPHSHVRADARAIKEAMDKARKALVKEATTHGV